MREVSALITTGYIQWALISWRDWRRHELHSAQQTNASVTYGWQIAQVASGGPSDGKLKVGDIIIALNNQKIRNNDDLASYLEEHTLPGDNLS